MLNSKYKPKSQKHKLLSNIKSFLSLIKL